MYSPMMADKILNMSMRLVQGQLTTEAVRTAILEMGPACVFDDMKNPDEVNGAMKILNWLDNGE